MRSDAQPRSDEDLQATVTCCRLVRRRLDEVSPHPSYVRHHLSVSASQLATLATLGDYVFQLPILITQDGWIIDGYARFELARLEGHASILCLEYDLTKEEALRWLIQSHRPARSLNAFRRIRLALDLEPSLHEKARANQRAGGRNEGSHDLTEAKRWDVRSEIAAIAGVSTGNVTKVRQLGRTVHPTVEQALENGEVSIHKAWQWSAESSEQQLENLTRRRLERGIKKKVRALVADHQGEILPSVPDPNSFNMPALLKLVTRLATMSVDESNAFGPIIIVKLDVPGKEIYITRELTQAFGPQQERLTI